MEAAQRSFYLSLGRTNMAIQMPSNEQVLGEGVVDCKDHLDIQHKVCGRMGKKGYRAERVSVSTWKENVTKKVGFGFMGIKQSHVGLCTLVRPLHLCFLV